MPLVGTDVEAAGELWVHDLHYEEEPGYYFFGNISPLNIDGSFFKPIVCIHYVSALRKVL
jgi:hypothetical protein